MIGMTNTEIKLPETPEEFTLWALEYELCYSIFDHYIAGYIERKHGPASGNRSALSAMFSSDVSATYNKAHDECVEWFYRLHKKFGDQFQYKSTAGNSKRIIYFCGVPIRSMNHNGTTD